MSVSYDLIVKSAAAVIASVTLANAAPVHFSSGSGANGHYYEVVKSKTNYLNAQSIADSMQFNGLQGYLATITSAEEQSFLESNFGKTFPAWIGASDEGSPDIWSWITGPEAGTVFYDGSLTVQPGYSNWNGTGEPNGGDVENYAVFRQFGTTGQWNDAIETAERFFLVEYGGITAPPGNTLTPVPLPASALLLAGGLAAMGFGLRKKAAKKPA
ncbi:MAG: lectin-like protein [Pseudomonadota bacterium]